MIVYAAMINDTFSVHRHSLKKIKTIISDYLRLDDEYFGDDAVDPSLEIYQEGIRKLKEEVLAENPKANSDPQLMRDKIAEKAGKLINLITEDMEDLDFEERMNPQKILGFKINWNVLKSISFGVVSVAIALVQRNLLES